MLRLVRRPRGPIPPLCVQPVALSGAVASLTARFISPHSGHDIAIALLGGASFSTDERAQLDRFGNKDGVFDLTRVGEVAARASGSDTQRSDLAAYRVTVER